MSVKESNMCIYPDYAINDPEKILYDFVHNEFCILAPVDTEWKLLNHFKKNHVWIFHRGTEIVTIGRIRIEPNRYRLRCVYHNSDARYHMRALSWKSQPFADDSVIQNYNDAIKKFWHILRDHMQSWNDVYEQYQNGE